MKSCVKLPQIQFGEGLSLSKGDHFRIKQAVYINISAEETEDEQVDY